MPTVQSKDKMIRSFLAVPLPDSLKQRLAELQNDLRQKLRNVRWTRPEALHLTLRFLGDVTQEDLDKIRTSVLSVERTQKAFEVTAKGLAAFPDSRRPRVLWIGLEPAKPLTALHSACQAALTTAGIAPEERPFRPHLTLGRLKRQEPGLASLISTRENQAVGTFPVQQLVLYQSLLHRSGAEHIPLLTVDLPPAGTLDSGNMLT